MTCVYIHIYQLYIAHSTHFCALCDTTFLLVKYTVVLEVNMHTDTHIYMHVVCLQCHKDTLTLAVYFSLCDRVLSHFSQRLEEGT